MIIIEAISENNTFRPSRILTDEEKLTIIYTKFDGVDYKYYQHGDEVPILDLGDGDVENNS
jgi:hypothetical protein